VLRRWLLWILALGLVGTETELLLLAHYQEPAQFVPVLLIPCAMVALAWDARRHDSTSLRTLRIIMVFFLLTGFVGVGLHFRGAAEFQLETNPGMSKWELIKNVMRVKAPPVLAPGVMLQLGLLGLVYAASNSRDMQRMR
jgi:hypothetical protein